MSKIAKGTIVVDELIIPITDIVFKHGLLEITACIEGPVPAVCSAPYRLFGVDGSEIYCSGSFISWPAIIPGAVLDLTVLVKFEHLRPLDLS